MGVGVYKGKVVKKKNKKDADKKHLTQITFCAHTVWRHLNK